MSHSLIVMPDDTAKPILDAINGAKKSIRVKMFLFSDPALLDAVEKAQKRGVKVRVMLNPARRSGESENEETTKKLKAAKVDVQHSNPEFDVTHEKSMVVDDETAFVHSLNWDTKNLTVTRDYAVVTQHGPEVKEIIECFEADWHRKPFKVDANSHLIWCNSNGRDRIERFVRAKERGVKIHVLARPAHTLKIEKLIEGVGGLRIMDDVGIKIHKLKHLKLHGKILLADHARAIVGSINLTPGSFDSRRELAIEVHAEEVVERLTKITHHDWENSHPQDLSDEGLMEDLERHKIDGSEVLALDEEEEAHDHKHKHKHN